MCRWNCLKLGEALAPLLPAVDDVAGRNKAMFKAGLAQFDASFQSVYRKLMLQKVRVPIRCCARVVMPVSWHEVQLGLYCPFSANPDVPSAASTVASASASSDDGDLDDVWMTLVRDLHSVMQATGADYTNTFRVLCEVCVDGEDGANDTAVMTLLRAQVAVWRPVPLSSPRTCSPAVSSAVPAGNGVRDCRGAAPRVPPG